MIINAFEHEWILISSDNNHTRVARWSLIGQGVVDEGNIHAKISPIESYVQTRTDSPLVQPVIEFIMNAPVLIRRAFDGHEHGVKTTDWLWRTKKNHVRD